MGPSTKPLKFDLKWSNRATHCHGPIGGAQALLHHHQELEDEVSDSFTPKLLKPRIVFMLIDIIIQVVFMMRSIIIKYFVC